MTRQTNRDEDRIDRIERWLEQLIERQIHTDNRLDRLENALEITERLIARNAELIERNAVRIAELTERLDQTIGAVNPLAGVARPPAEED